MIPILLNGLGFRVEGLALEGGSAASFKERMGGVWGPVEMYSV